jgi:hypothetical protein
MSYNKHTSTNYSPSIKTPQRAAGVTKSRDGDKEKTSKLRNARNRWNAG